MKFNKRKIHTLIEYQYNKRTKQYDEITDEFYLHNGAVALAGGAPVRTVGDWAFYDDGTESGAAIIGLKNNNQTLDVDTIYHIRFAWGDTAGNKWNNPSIQLQYNLNSGGWNNVNAASSVVQSAGAGSGLTDGGNTTQRLALVSTTWVVTGGQEEVDGLFSTTIDPTDESSELVLAFTIISGDVVDTDTIELKIIDAGAVEDFDVVPTWPVVTVNEAGGTDIDCTLDALTLTAYNTTVNAETSFTTTLDLSTLTAYNATINAETSFTTTLDSLTLTEQNATVNAETSFTTNVDNLVLTTFIADVSLSEISNLAFPIKRRWTKKPATAQLDFSNAIVKKIGRGEIFCATNNTPLKGLAKNSTLTLNGSTAIVTSVKGKGHQGTNSINDYTSTDDLTLNGWGSLTALSVVYYDSSDFPPSEIDFVREAAAVGTGVSLALPTSSLMRGLIATDGTSFWTVSDDQTIDTTLGWYVVGMTWDGATRRMWQAPLGQVANELGDGVTVTGNIVIGDSGNAKLCFQGGLHTSVYGYNQPQILNVVLEGCLTKAEIDSFCKNPWQILQSQVRIQDISVPAAGEDTNINATVDALTLAEQNASVNAETSFTTTLDALALTEYNASVNAETNLTTTLDALTLAELNATIKADISFTTTVDSLTLTAYQANVSLGVNIDADVDALVLTEYNATIKIDTGVTVNVDELALTEQQASINTAKNFTTTLDSLALTEYPANINAGINIDTNVDALTLSAHNATVEVSGDIDIDATVDALTLVEYSASINAGLNISADVDALTLTEYNATVKIDTSFTTVVDALTLAAFQTTVEVGGNVVVNADVDALTLTEYQAGINAGINIGADVDALTVTEYQCTVNVGTNISASADALTLTELPVTLKYDRNIVATADALTLSAYASTVVAGATSTTYKTITGGQMLATNDDTAFPLEIAIDDSGGVEGLAVTISIRDVGDSSSYLDFDDMTFKTSGWVTKEETMVDIGSGFYGVTLDIASITNLPSGKHLSLEYDITGTIVAINSQILTIESGLSASGNWGYLIEGAYSAEEIMRIMASGLAAKASGMESNAPVFRDINDTKDRITAVTDQYGNRTGVTLDVD